MGVPTEDDDIDQDSSPNGEIKFVSVDDMIPYVGNFKQFQWILGAMFCTIMLPSTYQIFLMYFGGLHPSWRCTENSTLCVRNGSFSYLDELRCSLPRNDWEYTEPKEFSIVTYYDIYCGNAWLIELSSSIIFAGWAFGSLIIGWAADNYGRRDVIFISTGMMLLTGFLSTFMPNVYSFIFFRFLTGVFIPGTNIQPTILLAELADNKRRPLAGILIWVFFPIALCLLSLKAYLIHSWKLLFIVCSAPYFWVLFFRFFVPESPRWLRLHKKNEALRKTMERIARFNKKEIPSNIMVAPVNDAIDSHKSNPLDLFQTRKLTFITLNLGYSCFANGMVYYGLSFESGNLGGSLYLNFFLLSAVEIPAIISAIFLCDRFGRKKSTILAIATAGLACIVLFFLPNQSTVARVVLGMIGKLSVAISFNTIQIWGLEIYPTQLRAQAMGFLNITTRIGSAASPWVITGLVSLHVNGAYMCMGIVALVSAALLLLLSETKGLLTLETTEDVCNETADPETFPILDNGSPKKKKLLD